MACSNMAITKYYSALESSGSNSNIIYFLAPTKNENEREITSKIGIGVIKVITNLQPPLPHKKVF